MSLTELVIQNIQLNEKLEDMQATQINMQATQIELLNIIKSMQIRLDSLSQVKTIAKPKNKIEYKSDSEDSESSDEPDDPNDSDYIPESDDSDSDSSSISDEELCNNCKIDDDDL